MPVTHNRKSYVGACVICSKPFDTTRPDALYCARACSMIAYRRRKTDERIGAAAARREKADKEHRAAWISFFHRNADSKNFHQAHAIRLYEALRALGRLDDLPFEQLSFPSERPA